MKAIVRDGYGSPELLRLDDVETPEPGPGEVRVRVEAAGVNAGDWHIMRGKPWMMRVAGFGFMRPKVWILGSDVAGRVDAVGPGVTQFAVGDAVFGELSGCGFGGFAEYACAGEDVWVRKPEALDFEQAAAVPMAAVTALQGVRNHGEASAGQHVLVNGASGGVGHFAVQIAKALGAEVSGVCGTRNMEMVRGLGADHVVDYTREDFVAGGRRYDVILDVAGYRPAGEVCRALKPGGRYVFVGGSGGRFLRIMMTGGWISRRMGVKASAMLMQTSREDLEFVAGLVEQGQLVPVIDRTYEFGSAAEAVRYVEQGHVSGKVVLSVK